MKKKIALPIFVFLFSLFVSCSKDDEPVVEPLTVTSIVPANNATAVELNSTVAVTFSRAITSDISGIKLLAPDNSEVGCDKTLSGNIVTLKPKAELDPGIPYKIQVNAKTTDDATVNSTSSFTTKNVSLALVSITPTNGATAVSRSAKVIIILNKKVKNTVVNSIAILPLPGEMWSVDYDGNKTITMSCTTALKANTKYDLRQFTPIESLTDADKLTLPTYSFTTGN